MGSGDRPDLSAADPGVLGNTHAGACGLSTSAQGPRVHVVARTTGTGSPAETARMGFSGYGG